MKIKNSEYRIKRLTLIGRAAQVAFVLSIVLGRLENPSLAFLTGLLMGFSVVGNLAYLTTISRQNRKGA
jgi:hypothetical protein